MVKYGNSIVDVLLKTSMVMAIKAPCIVESGSYAFTTVYGPEYMNLDMYILFLKECKPCKQVVVTFYLAQNPMLLFVAFEKFSKR